MVKWGKIYVTLTRGDCCTLFSLPTIFNIICISNRFLISVLLIHREIREFDLRGKITVKKIRSKDFLSNNSKWKVFNVWGNVVITEIITHLIIFSYSLSRPLESLQRRYITEASTLAGLNVFGSLSREITDKSMVRTFWVGFQRSHGSSPDCGSSTGGWRILMHKSPFWNKILPIKRIPKYHKVQSQIIWVIMKKITLPPVGVGRRWK